MKKLFVVAVLGLFLAGCGAAAKQSEFWQHDAMYKDWSHLRFSWTGYRNPTQDDVQKTQEDGWWGIEIPYVPAE